MPSRLLLCQNPAQVIRQPRFFFRSNSTSLPLDSARMVCLVMNMDVFINKLAPSITDKDASLQIQSTFFIHKLFDIDASRSCYNALPFYIVIHAKLLRFYQYKIKYMFRNCVAWFIFYPLCFYVGILSWFCAI